MAYEAGGRADKLGNLYESKWLVKQYIRLLRGQIAGVIHEPIQDATAGIDIEVHLHNGSIEYYQCKGFNSDKQWTPTALNREKILEKAANILQASNNSVYTFVTADSVSIMRDLCERAKNSTGSIQDYRSQLSESLRENFEAVCIPMGNDPQTSLDCLRRISFIQQPDDEEYEKNLILFLSFLVTNHQTAYSLLLTYVETNQKFGHMVTQDELELYLVQNDCQMKNLQRNDSIPGKIRELNKSFQDLFSPIDGYIANKETFDSLTKDISQNRNLLILGAAGIGKTGFIRELTNHLERTTIPHLAIRLDAFPPKTNLQDWGHDLGLPDSPVQCLRSCSPQKTAVLLLDQLDAIRWTSNHQSSATMHMLSLIREIQLLNLETPEHPIVLVLACRKFDFDYDATIQMLFKGSSETFKRVQIDELDDSQLLSVLGDSYREYPIRLKKLLRTPSNLYFWQRLYQPNCLFISQRDLINQWWLELKNKADNQQIAASDLQSIVATINEHISNGASRVLRSRFPSEKALAFLASEGFLVSDDNQRHFHYVHQSIYDYFISDGMYEQVSFGFSFAECLGDFNAQTPMKRYQFQMLLEAMIANDSDLSEFYDKASKALASNKIRYYLKHVIFEVVGQLSIINEQTASFVTRLYRDSVWHQAVFSSIFLKHPVYIRYLYQSGQLFDLIHSDEHSESAYSLLHSLADTDEALLSTILTEYAFADESSLQRYYHCLGYNTLEESQELFDVRCRMLRTGRISDRFNLWLHNITQNNAARALDYLEILVETNASEKGAPHSQEYINHLSNALNSQGFTHFKSIMNQMEARTCSYTVGQGAYCRDEEWNFQTHDISTGRLLVEVMNSSSVYMAQNFPHEVYELLLNSKPTAITNDTLLLLLLHLPEAYADNIVTWLTQDFPNRLFCENLSKDRLDITKKILSKHSSRISANVFAVFENKLIQYPGRRWVLENKCGLHRKVHERIDYPSDYGRLQAALLPYLDSTRLTTHSKQFIDFTKRKFLNNDTTFPWIHLDEFVTVRSPLGEKVTKLSDKNWLRIINTPTNKTGSQPFGIKTTPCEFAGDLRHLSQTEPLRVFRLLMQGRFPLHTTYLSLAFQVAETSKCIPTEDILSLINTYHDYCTDTMSTQFCWLIQKNAEREWPDSIINLVCHIALHHNEPAPTQGSSTDSQDVFALETLALNSARGAAVHTIAELIKHQPQHREKLIKTINNVCKDDSLAVCHAVLFCIPYIVDTYEDIAYQWFHAIGERDIRNYAGRPVAYFFFHFWKNHSNDLRLVIMRLFYSNLPECQKAGVSLLVRAYMKYGEFADILEQENIQDEELAERILHSCARYLDNQNIYRANAISLYKSCLHKWPAFQKSCDTLFTNNRLDITTDMELIKLIAAAKPSRRLLANLSEYLDANTYNPREVSDLLCSICNAYGQAKGNGHPDDYWYLHEIERYLPKLVQRLYDSSSDDPDIRIMCLDLWDELYKEGIGVRWQDE